MEIIIPLTVQLSTYVVITCSQISFQLWDRIPQITNYNKSVMWIGRKKCSVNLGGKVSCEKEM